MNYEILKKIKERQHDEAERLEWQAHLRRQRRKGWYELIVFAVISVLVFVLLALQSNG